MSSSSDVVYRAEVVIKDVQHALFTITRIGSSFEVQIPDLYAEEERDVMVVLTLPAFSEPQLSMLIDLIFLFFMCECFVSN